jgi:glycine dehydrogenase subunit 1
MTPMTSYVPHTASERAQMLRAMGLSDVNELFRDIPKGVRLERPLKLPEGLSELETAAALQSLADQNRRFRTVLRGAGAYRHFIPSVVRQLAAREEFVTAYTPYQAEISQGVLQAIFEYQTMICNLTGMDVSNASVYDGATAAAEAAGMCRERSRNKILLSAAADPQVIRTVRTYAGGTGMQVELIPASGGKTCLDSLAKLAGTDTACVYLASPNYFGLVEDCAKASEITHGAGAKLIVGVNPISLGLFKSPGELGADIAVGEGQPLGMPLSFGGPYLGFMACKTAMGRKLPGRIVGETADIEGKRAYVLTLQAREQHIRREKATSSICSNEALCALTASIYLSAMGPQGLAEVAGQCYDKAHYAKQALTAIPGFEALYEGEFFHEFATRCPVDPQLLMHKLADADILGGLPLTGEQNGCILWCFTEVVTRAEIDRLAEICKEVAAQ